MSENRISITFDRLLRSGTKAFVAYMTAGDPSLEKTIELTLALERAGADIIELGIPFSDPLADGVVNQMAAYRALKAGATIPKLLDTLILVRKQTEIPIVLFTYLNPLYQYGYRQFHADAATAGADGLLVLDLPPEEEAANTELAGGAGLCHIRLVAPNTPERRLADIAASASGFIYAVSREGVTGEQQRLSAGIADQVASIRRHTSLPIAVGFGISTPEQAAQVAQSADGVVVGSAIVRRIAEHGPSDRLVAEVESFVRPLAAATHAHS